DGIRDKLVTGVQTCALPILVLAAQQGDTIGLSLSHKRRSEGEAGRVVIEGIRDVQLNLEAPENEGAFLASLAVSRLPNRDMFARSEERRVGEEGELRVVRGR